jgi:hypothetical protein
MSKQQVGSGAAVVDGGVTFAKEHTADEDRATFENIDRTVTISFRPKGLSRGAIVKLYAEARGDLPISLEIARAITVHPGAKVGILTGAAVPNFLPTGENDGPLGAFVLARALRALGHEVVFLTESELTGIFEGLFHLYQESFPIIHLQKEDPGDHTATAPDLEILISIEKLGSNKQHVMHGATGTSRNGTRAHVDGLVRRMNEQGRLTVGIGDGGNEIGFGKIYELARSTVDFGQLCRCPCGGGIVTITSTQHLFPVAVSNWGAYGLTAALAALTGQMQILHTPQREHELLALAKKLDCRDGASGTARESVDGVPAETSAAVVQMLKTLAETINERVERAF